LACRINLMKSSVAICGLRELFELEQLFGIIVGGPCYFDSSRISPARPGWFQ